MLTICFYLLKNNLTVNVRNKEYEIFVAITNSLELGLI